jgi:flagellar motor switch protein FliM
MSKVLQQGEVDALLASVADGAPAPGQAPSAAASAGARNHPAVEPHPYDFKRPERVSQGQLHVLRSVHEGFAREFAATLSGVLRTIVGVRVVSVEQLAYREFVDSLANPTCLLILQTAPLEGRACLEISPLLVYPLIDRLLGGNNASTFIPRRPLTAIEWRLVNRIAQRALDHLSETWRSLVDIGFEIVGMETDPQLARVVPPTEVVVFITFEVRFGRTADAMSLCIPFNMIEPVLSRLAAEQNMSRAKPATDRQQQRLLRNLARSPVELAAYLGRATIRLSELRNLRPGDLIPLDKRVGDGLILQIRGRNKFAGKPGQFGGKRALRLTRHAEADETL